MLLTDKQIDLPYTESTVNPHRPHPTLIRGELLCLIDMSKTKHIKTDDETVDIVVAIYPMGQPLADINMESVVRHLSVDKVVDEMNNNGFTKYTRRMAEMVVKQVDEADKDVEQWAVMMQIEDDEDKYNHHYSFCRHEIPGGMMTMVKSVVEMQASGVYNDYTRGE